jgi:hypothetical protein
MTEESSAALENVELLEEEHIVARGTRTVVWLVRVHDAWVPAGQISGAVATRLAAPAGCVFRRRIELTLPRETRVLRVESRPKLERRTPLDYLSRDRASGKAQQKTEFRVGRTGTLVRAAPRPRP